MNFRKIHFRKTALGVAFGLMIISPWVQNVYGASSHSKIEDGVYQLRDGTPVAGIWARGIDVSHWQGSIDWQQVAANDISFVMLGTRYNGQVDPRFHENATNAANAGIQLGIYIYSYATDVAMAEAEADFVLDLIKDYPVSYPVAFDVEATVQSTLSPDLLADMVNAFCRKIEDAGYHAVLYANDYWLANKINMSRVNYDVWVARYEVKHAYGNPVMWQATSTGFVDGIQGNVDIDFQYKDFSDVIIPNLWRTIGGKTYYFQNHRMQKDTWIHDGTGWFFMNEEGLAVDGWLTRDGNTYYLDPESRRMVVGWRAFPEGWRFFGSSGAMRTGWIHDGTAWYYLNKDAIMQTGWLQDGEAQYYLSSSGAMVDGWQQLDGAWYYFNGSGAMQTGMQQIGDSWYYLDSNGVMQTGSFEIQGNWYYFGDNGAMQTGLRQVGDSWYYFNQQNGIMTTGWQQIDHIWYYFGGDGRMQTGWVSDASNWYYLNPENGQMYANTQIVVDGVTYDVDASGACREVVVQETPENPVPAEPPAANEGVMETPAAEEIGPGVGPGLIAPFGS